MTPVYRFRRAAVAVAVLLTFVLGGSQSIIGRAGEPPANPTTPIPPAIGNGGQGAKAIPVTEQTVSIYGTNSGRSIQADATPKTGDPGLNVAMDAPPIAIGPDRTLHFNRQFFPPSGAFFNPFMMTFDAVNNELYVSDYNNNRVLVYTASGLYLRQVGSSANYNGPGGIVVNGAIVYIADCGNGRIARFDRASNSFLGTLGGGLGCPTGLAVHPVDGFLYVVETSGNRVHKYGLDGSDQGTFGTPGAGNGQFNTPYGIAIDVFGYIYVADSANNRIAKFYTGGTFARNFGTSGTTPGFTQYPIGLAIDRAGLLYVTDVNNGRVQKFDGVGTFKGYYVAPQTAICSGTFGTTCLGYFYSLRGIAVGPNYEVFTSDAGNNTVQRFESAMNPLGRFNIQSYGGAGSGFGQFNSIGGTAIDSAENVYATDFNNHRVQKFDKFGNFITAWGNLGTGNGQFNNPYGIAIDRNDVIYVVDSSNHRVQRFNINGTYLSQFGSLGTGNGQFTYPSGIAVDADLYVYVTEENNHRVQKLDVAGAFIKKWGTLGSALGQLNIPTGIAVDEQRGMVYVAEFGNNRVQAFTVYGDPVEIFAPTTGGTCAVSQPIGLATDQRGNILVASRGNSKLMLLNGSGRCLGTVASNAVQAVSISRKNGQAFTGGSSTDNLIRRVGAPNPRNDTVGVWRPSTQTFLLRNSNTTGLPDISSTVVYANSTDLPVTGDWNGDGVDTFGLYRPASSVFYLFDSTVNPNMVTATYIVLLGNPGDTPMAGDWDADGKDGVGVYRPSNGILYLKNALVSGFSDYAMVLGNPSDNGIAGDWDGDGADSAGIYRPNENRFYLSDRNTNGIVFGDYAVLLGDPGDQPFIGDWIGQGSSGVGVFRPSNGFLYLKNGLTGVFPDTSLFYGTSGDVPLAGTWGTPPALPLPPPITPEIVTPTKAPLPPILIYGSGTGYTNDNLGGGAE